jgi:hypothetical protein
MSERTYVWANWSALRFNKPCWRKNYRLITNHYEFGADRFGILQDVADLKAEIITKPVEYNLSNLTNDWYDRYVSITESVADKVYKIAGDRTISLCYSGGVDSVQVLCALVQHPKFKEKLDAGQFILNMTSSSILEYSKLFYEFILPTIPIVVMDHQRDMNDPNIMLITGDHGDYLIGSQDIHQWWPDGNKSIDLPRSELEAVWRSIDTEGKCVEPLLKGLISRAPFEITSVAQLAWWFSQAFAGQDELVRPYVWSDVDVAGIADDDHKVFRFFYDREFATYSFELMSTNPTFKSSSDFRNFPKQYIFDYTKDAFYVKNKEKLYSQKHTVRVMQKTIIYKQDGVFKYTDDITDLITI